MFRIEVSIKAGFPEPRGEGLQKDIQDLGITTVEKAKVTDIYLLEGSLNEEEVRRICRELLVDPVVEEYSYGEASITGVEDSNVRVIEVAYNPGVMDPVEESVKKGILDLGIATVDSVKTAKSYYLCNTGRYLLIGFIVIVVIAVIAGIIAFIMKKKKKEPKEGKAGKEKGKDDKTAKKDDKTDKAKDTKTKDDKTKDPKTK